MKAGQYEAIRKSGVEEFAIYPADVEEELPYAINFVNSRKSQNVRACPTGLLPARIIEDNAHWKERFTLGCGDTEYERERKNGVLVELRFDTFLSFVNRLHRSKKTSARTLAKSIKDAPRSTLGKNDDGVQVVQMVVSKAAIMAPWNEYALIEAEREKEREATTERNERLDAVARALGNNARCQFREVASIWDSEKQEYVRPAKSAYDYSLRRDTDGEIRFLRGEVILTLPEAERIAARLKQGGNDA